MSRRSHSARGAPQPFAVRLQCLRCYAYWWSNPDSPSHCPKCPKPEPKIVQGPEGPVMQTTYGVVRVVS